MKCFHCGARGQSAHETCTVCGRVVRLPHGEELTPDPRALRSRAPGRKKNPSLFWGLAAVGIIILFGNFARHQSPSGGSISNWKDWQKEFGRVKGFTRLWDLRSVKPRIWNLVSGFSMGEEKKEGQRTAKALPLCVLSPLMPEGTKIRGLKCLSNDFRIKYFKISSQDTDQCPPGHILNLFRIKASRRNRRQSCVFSYTPDNMTGLDKEAGTLSITFTPMVSDNGHMEYFLLPAGKEKPAYPAADQEKILDQGLVAGYRINQVRGISISFKSQEQPDNAMDEQAAALIQSLPH